MKLTFLNAIPKNKIAFQTGINRFVKYGPRPDVNFRVRICRVKMMATTATGCTQVTTRFEIRPDMNSTSSHYLRGQLQKNESQNYSVIFVNYVHEYY
jgi:hypothetical protein